MHLYRQPTFAVHRCGACGVVFVVGNAGTTNAHAQQRNATSENEHIRQAMSIMRSLHYIETVFVSRHDFWLAHWDRRLARIETILGRTGRLLDIGCAVGHFQLAAEARGWKTVGIEPSTTQSDHARRHFGLDVRTAYWHEVPFQEASFDLITAWSVLEHVAEPRAFLAQIQRWLKPEGLLALQTPNQASLISALAAWGYRCSGERFLLPIYSDEHRYRFDMPALERLLNLSGFKPLTIEPYDNLAIMQTRMALAPRPRLRNAALAAVHGAAGLLGRQNQLVAYARPAERGM